MAVGRQLDLSFLRRGAALGRLRLAGFRRPVPIGEHQVRGGVFVVDAEQAMVRAVRAERQRLIADVVAVVAELLFLGRTRLMHRIEGRRSLDHLVAPADQDIGIVAGSYLMALADLVRRLGKRQRRGSLRRLFRRGGAHHLRQGSRSGDGGRRRHQAFQKAPAAGACLGDFDKRHIGRIVGADVVTVFDRDRLVAFIETGHASFPPALSYWAAGPSGRNSRLETECNKKFIFRAGQEVGTANPKV